MSGAEAEEAEALAAQVAFDADIEGSPTAPRENGASTFSTPQRQGAEVRQGLDEDDVREGETPEEALQRRIEEGNIGKGKTLRRWKDTEEKQRMVETGRHQSKVQRYGQIYEEVRALRKETRHSVRDLRERYKDKGVIQNKDQFIVKLIAQERNEQEGKVAAIKSLQQWRLTDVELHNFINRQVCHKKGIAGKLDLAMQWAVEQEEAGGEVNFKEGLAFYSSIGILQPRSSAHTQQQWREWREWEDALTCALGKFKKAGAEGAADVKGAEATGPEGSCSNEDSTVCNSPWSSERGGGGSFGGFSGNLRASSSHGEGGRRPYSSSGTAADNGTAPEQTMRDAMPLHRRGRNSSHRGDFGGDEARREWSWRSYSPPSTLSRHRGRNVNGGGGGGAGGAKKNAPAGFVQPASGLPGVDGGTATNGKPPPSPSRVDSPDRVGGGSGKSGDSLLLGESVVRSSGGYLPPRHPLAALQLSPTSQRSAVGSDSEETGAGRDPGRENNGGGSGAEPESVGGGAEAARAPTEGSSSSAAAAVAAEDTPEVRPAGDAAAEGPAPTEGEGPAPTEGEGGGKSAAPGDGARRRLRYSDAGGGATRAGGGGGSDSRSVSGVFSGLADWLMPGMERRRPAVKTELLLEVYPSAPQSPERGQPPVVTRSAPPTPRGRRRPTSVLRDGGWFYNGDSDYSTEEEVDGSFESEDEGFWADAAESKAPQRIGGGGGDSILTRLKKLFT
ncbi:unnamed protein product [Ectocarpus sp. 6 AP-2014]